MKGKNRAGVVRRRRRLKLGEDGQAMTEFVITFPIILIVVCTILEFALMFNAKSMVSYAAFCGARSAAVFVPREYEVFGMPFEDPNEVGFWKKFFKVHMSASIALAPISPEGLDVASKIPIVGPFLGMINDVFESLPGTIRDILDGVDRMIYAFAATSGFGNGGISISGDVNNNETGWGHTIPPGASGGDVIVKVNYTYRFQIPIIRKLLGWHWFPARRHLWSWIWLGSETFWEINGVCAIPNEPQVSSSQQSEDY